MSTLETDIQTQDDEAPGTGLPHVDERPERVVAVRRFDAKITSGDGRTVSFRIAPFGEIAVSADGLGGVPKGVPYSEELMPGLYDRQLKAANRVLLNFEHQQGLAGVIGHAVELRHERDGYHASFRIQETPDGDKALLLARDGVLSGASVESYWLKSIRTAGGVVQRVKAHLEAVAMCRQGAYPGAVLTGLRSDEIPDEILMDEELLPVSANPELIERCRQLGIRMPQRYEAHPDEADTPADAGTSEDGTRPDQATAESEGVIT
jgi:HK97 family phage prohead protease